MTTSRVFAADESGSIIESGEKLRKLQGEYIFTEGPAADAHGNVYFTDQPNDRFVKWNASDESVEDWLKPAGRSNGTYFDEYGNLVACADEKNELWSIAPNKSIKVLIRDLHGKLLNGPNDLWIHPNGSLYFTDPLFKRDYWKRDPEMQQPGRYVYYFSRISSEPIPVIKDFKQPNGIIGTPDGKTLYVSDIDDNKTWVYTILENGLLTDKRLFCEMGSDGMTIDNRGNVYLTGKGVHVFNSRGEKIEHIDVPEDWTGNVTFGGEDKNLLFITASRGIYGIKMNVHSAETGSNN